ncbi:Carboxylesterase type B [Penicillium chermesinum]|uniref:Carboxylic ester hydrolase n=1 Tax=Penicillium chermesinum TaxID=63820 RepID=A0A9W9P6X4_9EURO|nr:Carboxylesterase type B [Penicillium chermesinum]KAJ5239074.1 Carboxylesterase type B [Penicillium chermesinum]KAJ6164713.1 Carboxylesterase type B [Penicillium chermesinum]
MPNPQVHHERLDATFDGISRDDGNTVVNQFLGIKYGTVPARFEKSVPVDTYRGAVVDATRFGPRCPQVDVDVRHLLRLPEDFIIPPEPESEFDCLNLEITSPSVHDIVSPLPVLIWIHGGSQVVTFCSAASKICDPTKLVADSIRAGKPMIFVAVHYRLNIFGFGDGNERNLALKDQRIAIGWVRRNIAPFGGDPEQITLAGESAGAVYAHAHLITGPPVKRAVLASGSLYLSSPLPTERGSGMIKSLNSKVQELSGGSLREAPVPILIQALKDLNVNTMWLQEEPELHDWETRPEQTEELMIGDAEYEAAIWRNGVEMLTGPEIVAAFERNAEWGLHLRRAYQVVQDRPTASKLGALDFVNDARFTLPVEIVSKKLQDAGKRVNRYVVDQPNPFQQSSRPHHAVDLLFLFGGVAFPSNPAADAVSKEMRQRWVRFVAGDEPWAVDKRFAYGPLGECREIDESEFAFRRRVSHCRVLQQAGSSVYMPIMAALTAGRISLLN